MNKVAVVALVSLVAVLGSLACKKGGAAAPADPKALCETIFADRIDGMIKPFAEEGPKHKAEFDAYCVKLPVEYLQCEAKDIMTMPKHEVEKCMDLIRQHQAGLNNVLMTGKPE
ncbi:MAG: hypothetical protein HY905_09600 [Deltaproteobacteria bacterium]|nr:hypothetical protein [Deltaproteobacteria bacterium]